MYEYVCMNEYVCIYVCSNQSGEGTGVELPSIFDEEETEERDKRALTNSLGQGSRSGRLRNQEQDFDKIDLTHSAGPKTGELNRIIGVLPTFVCMYVYVIILKCMYVWVCHVLLLTIVH